MKSLFSPPKKNYLKFVEYERIRTLINFCAKVFKAFGVAFTVLVDHRIVYQVGESWQCDNIEALERKAEQMLQYRKREKHG